MEVSGRQGKAYAPLSPREELVGKGVVESALSVHRALGPGLLESVYEVCFCHELRKQGLAAKRQVVVPINYDGIQFEEAFRLDVLVENLVVCELKSVEAMNPIFTAQIITQLRLSGKRLGFLINFNVPLIKKGIQRIVL